MLSQILQCLLLIRLTSLVVVAVRATGEDHGVNDSGSDKCASILDVWVNKAQPVFLQENKTLQVSVGSLYHQLRTNQCFTQNQLWLELWWVTDHPDRPENFGSSSYFEKYERCRQLEPEHFVFHSTSKLESGTSARNKNDSKVRVPGDKVVFTHVVEREYVLRVCPCGRTRHNAAGLKVCDCKYSSSGKPHCSSLFQLDQGENAVGVYPWCREDATDQATAKMTVHSPVVNCTSVLLTGVLPSCTPLQPYDRVQLALHLYNENVTDMTTFECNKHHHFGDEKPVIVETFIHNLNDSHGDFSIHLGQLKPNAVYCLQLELVEHPYCNSHLTIGHGSGFRPKVCSSYLMYPVITPPCLVSHGQLVLQSAESRLNYVVMIVATGLACIVGCVCVAFFCLFKCVKKQTVVTGKGQSHEARGHRPQRSRPRTSSLENGQSIFAVNDHVEENVFLLRMPHSSCTDDMHIMFVQWLSSIGCRVHDMTNPDEDEAINADPEGWVQDILNEPNVKVVIIEGDSIVVQSDLETKENKMLMVSQAPSSMSGTGSTSLTISATSSVDDRWSKKSHDDYVTNAEEDFEIDPLLDDPRAILRVFAWKYIQSHFVGKYNQVLVVRFVTGASDGPMDHSSAVSSLTPLRMSLLVPHHLPEIRQWLRPTTSTKSISHVSDFLSSSSPTRTASDTLNTNATLSSEKRLLAALGVSQYDCI